jgi:hypothetical protein
LYVSGGGATAESCKVLPQLHTQLLVWCLRGVSQEGRRGPLLTMKEITHIDHLQPFFETMATFHYLGDVARASVDAEAVEALLDNEVCEAVPTNECLMCVVANGILSTIFVKGSGW